MNNATNFEFLRGEWPDLCETAARVESAVMADPRVACFYARWTLERAVTWMFTHDRALTWPYDRSLSALLHEATFRRAVRPEIWEKARLIKEVGNGAVHQPRPVRPTEAVGAAEELWHFLAWFARTYTRRGASTGLAAAKFNPGLLPAAPAVTARRTAEQVRALAEQLAAREAELTTKAQAVADLDAALARAQAEVAAAKAANAVVPDRHDYDEAATRDRFIDLMLREAGWALDQPEDTEYPVTGMPNQASEGFVDYVLWGSDGRPLAVVEAKRTKKDPKAGEHQAKLYADCLEAKFGRRPALFYTNGYKTWLWDDTSSPPRPVQGFYRREELELLLQRRTTRRDPGSEPVNRTIVERHYQERALRAIGAEFTGGSRKALLVMATGAGKTRTAVALVELLQRCGWVKRALFLADRVALVNQTCNAFKAHLPDSSPVNLCTEKTATGGRVFVSTYPTILNLIEHDRVGGDGAVSERRFGVGFFDLVIIDEAHRSVFQRYRAIFDYFDALLVGLTATPRDEIDRNTYGLFDLERGVPTDAYELNDAVADGFLVPPRAVSVPLRFQREGIVYDKLSEAEKEAWDLLDWDEDEGKPDRVEAEAVNRWLFNADTVDKVLAHLMAHGLKVAGGDRLGKTIVFAKNHAHADFIRERFDLAYPECKGEFARVIDYETKYVQNLIDRFSQPEQAPHIAISVDMLDTGIDVPEVANLVFFKLVRSKTKFFQMLGRGTRLRKDLFGPGQPKEFFCVFDYCQNLEFFSQNPRGIESAGQPSLAATIFRRRLELVATMTEATAVSTVVGTGRAAEGEKEGDEKLRREIADALHAEVAAMNVQNFIVRPHREGVERFARRESWDQLIPAELSKAAWPLAGLPNRLPPEDELAKRWDLLLLNLQLAVLRREPAFERLRDQVRDAASQLEGKSAIPMVREQLSLISAVQDPAYWENVTLPMLELIRQRLRGLVGFIDRHARKPIYTDFEDQIGTAQEVTVTGYASGMDRAQFRKKVMHFLREHEDHLTLKKLKYNEPITALDLQELERLLFESGELEGPDARAQFERCFGPQPALGVFIRSLVGLDREAAKAAFGDYLDGTRFSASQLRFINGIVDQLTERGVMQPGQLYEQPFTDVNPNGLDGMFADGDATKIVSILSQIRANADASAA